MAEGEISESGRFRVLRIHRCDGDELDRGRELEAEIRTQGCLPEGREYRWQMPADSPQRLDEHVQARASGGELRSDELGFPVCEGDESSSSRDEQSHPGRYVGYTRMEWNLHPSTTLDSASSGRSPITLN